MLSRFIASAWRPTSYQAVHEKILRTGFDGLVAIMAEFGGNGCPTSLRARLQGLGGQTLSRVQRNSRQQHIDGASEYPRNRRRSGALYSNPARALGRAKLRAKDPPLPSREQFIHFEKEIRGGGGRHSRNCADFVQFVAFSGCRLSEAIGVTWRDVDFNKSEITIRGDAITGTKNSEVRRVPMIPELRSLLQRLRHERPEETNDTPILVVREAQKSMDRAAAKVGMRRITHHDLRHLSRRFASRAAWTYLPSRGGLDIKTAARCA